VTTPLAQLEGNIPSVRRRPRSVKSFLGASARMIVDRKAVLDATLLLAHVDPARLMEPRDC